MNGIDDAVVQRADYLGKLSSRGDDLSAVCSNISTKEVKDLRLAVGFVCIRHVLVCDFNESIGRYCKKVLGRRIATT